MNFECDMTTLKNYFELVENFYGDVPFENIF